MGIKKSFPNHFITLGAVPQDICTTIQRVMAGRITESIRKREDTTEIDKETGEPLDELDAIARRWCKTHGSTAKTVSDILKGPDQKVMEGIQKGIDRANEKAISNAQRIQKFTILEKDFSLQGGELGPTMKVKRNVVAQKYADIIDRFYK